MRHRNLIVAAAAAAVLVLIAGIVLLRVQRDREWAHGGDDLAVDVEVALADRQTFAGTVARFGVPAGAATAGADEQYVITRVRRAGSPGVGGRFVLLMVDKRVTPPGRLNGRGGWDGQQNPGFHWEGVYQPLSERYEWLRGFAADSGVSAVEAAGDSSVAYFVPRRDGAMPITDPAREVAIALVHLDRDNEVRWARRIYG